MVGGILFGGITFWILVALWLLVEGGCLYARHPWSLVALVLGVVAGFVFVENLPVFSCWWLVAYLVLSLIWLPIYWYLSLRKTASELKEAITEEGSLEQAYNKSYNYNNIREHISKERDGALFNYTVDIQNPSSDQLVANTLLSPISIPIFFAENLIEASIRTIKATMNSIRKSLSADINNKFKT